MEERELVYMYYRGAYSKSFFNKLYPKWLAEKNKDIMDKIKIIRMAKKTVFDDVSKLSSPLAGDFGETPMYKDFQELKKKHLKT